MKKVTAIKVELYHEKGGYVHLPLDENLKKEGVKTPEELTEIWAKKELFKKEFSLVEIEVERPDDLMICPNFNVLCFKEKMYPGWETFFSCWFAYEFGGLDAKLDAKYR